MSLKLPLYLHNHLNQAPGLALNAVAPYAQGIHYLKRKATDFLHTCGNQLQNTFNVVYPILHHPRSSSISGILFSTRYMADLTGMASIYQKISYLLSRRAGRMTFIENQFLVSLKKLSAYCEQLHIRSSIPWQRIPELQALEALEEELVNSQYLTNPDREKIAEALFCCDEIRALVTLHRSMNTEDLNREEIRAIEENAALNTILSAIEENTGEALGGYTPSLLAPILNDVLEAIPESYNPFALASNSIIASLRKISTIVGGPFVLTATSSNYFVSSHAQKTLAQLCAVSGISAIGLYYQEQIKEAAEEFLKIFLEIISAYGGMLLFNTDEPFRGYLHKIVPATAFSKATEYYLDSRESYAITSFVLPLLVSSLVYNQAAIQESYQKFKASAIRILNTRRQLLQTMASVITNQIINSSSSKLSRLALKRTIKQVCPLEFGMLAYTILQMNPPVGNQSLNNLFTPLLRPVLQQLLSQSTEQQVLQILNFSVDKSLMLLKEYLIILQQDDMQNLILRIQKKLNELDPESEGLKNNFLKEIFLKKTGTPLPLNDSILDALKKSSRIDIQAKLFTSFKNAPSVIRMLWNSYPYHKKVDQSLMLELLLQGFIITSLASLVPGPNTDQAPSFSYIRMANLTRKLVL